MIIHDYVAYLLLFVWKTDFHRKKKRKFDIHNQKE